MTEQTDRLERRYRRLLLAYPAPYRAERGDEIVGTYLAAADSNRRWPSVADVADLLRGGAWQHLRARGAGGLTAGIPVAANFALTAAVALAAAWLTRVEATWWVFPTHIGPFQDLGTAVWIAWLVAGVAVLALPARITRWFVLAALAATVAVEPISALSGYGRPPLLVLVPQVALGVLALGWPTRPTWPQRLTPVVIGAITALISIGSGITSYGSYEYRFAASGVLGAGAMVLLAGSLLAGIALSTSGDNRGLWAVLLLLLPVGLLAIDPLTRVLSEITGLAGPYGNQPNNYLALACVTVGVAILAAGALLLAIRLRGRQIHPQRERCPTCGR